MLRKLKQESYDFVASLGDGTIPCLKQSKTAKCFFFITQIFDCLDPRVSFWSYRYEDVSHKDRTNFWVWVFFFNWKIYK